ncbi:MAG TPA: dethiobiotin synthetase [Candidatus Dormibacteraeota bacterium]|nr:dethiobiotin synthetase [Candidatus Dormibacteraeota bacterium]
MPRRYVAVCGASDATPSQLDAAREVGRLLARSGAVVINGGYGGVSGAASEGAAGEGGTVVGILREETREGSNPHLTVSLPTGIGEGRNLLIVMAAESVIAIGRGWGTLSEIALARRLGRSVFALDTWDVEGLEKVATPDEAVRRAIGD